MTRLMLFALAAVIGGAALAQTTTDHCGAELLRGLIGQTGQIADLLSFEDRPFRVIVDDQPVTRDYRIERLNVVVEDGVIVDVACW